MLEATSIDELADGVFTRYDDGETLALTADLGPAANGATVDVVDGVAIVAVPTEGPDEEYQLDLPNDEAKAFIRNGVLTIEVAR